MTDDFVLRIRLTPEQAADLKQQIDDYYRGPRGLPLIVEFDAADFETIPTPEPAARPPLIDLYNALGDRAA